MNVIWHKWLDVLRELAVTQGLDYDLGQVEAPTARKYCQAANAAMEIAWKFHAWPACCWLMNSSYSKDAGFPPQRFMEPGFNVLAIYAENPVDAWNAGQEAEVILSREMPDGRYMHHGGEPPVSYHLVRPPPPRFGITPVVLGREYRTGELVYDPVRGEAWRCTATMIVTEGNPETMLPDEWEEWDFTGAYSKSASSPARHNGVLWLCKNHTTIPELNEPGFGSDFIAAWETTILPWAPMRVPDFLLQAVLHGARAWLHETPPLPRSALEKQMEGWLAAEVDNIRYQRRQFYAEGGALAIL